MEKIKIQLKEEARDKSQKKRSNSLLETIDLLATINRIEINSVNSSEFKSRREEYYKLPKNIHEV